MWIIWSKRNNMISKHKKGFVIDFYGNICYLTTPKMVSSRSQLLKSCYILEINISFSYEVMFVNINSEFLLQISLKVKLQLKQVNQVRS